MCLFYSCDTCVCSRQSAWGGVTGSDPRLLVTGQDRHAPMTSRPNHSVHDAACQNSSDHGPLRLLSSNGMSDRQARRRAKDL